VTATKNVPPVVTMDKDELISIDDTEYVSPWVSDPDGSIESYKWMEGSVVLSTKSSFEYTPKTVGKHTLTFTATDDNGATTSDTMDIIVVTTENKAPDITLNGDYRLRYLKLNVGETFVRPTPTAKDAIDHNDISSRIKVKENVDTSKAGTYYVNYTVTDTRGNVGLKILTVYVYDNLPPRITLNGARVVLTDIDEPYVDAGASAEDFIDGVIEVQTTGAVDTSKLGTYTITYTATDKAGESSSKTREVRVVPARPVITLEGPGISKGADGHYHLTLVKGDRYPSVDIKSKATLKGKSITVTRPFDDYFDIEISTRSARTLIYKFKAVNPTTDVEVEKKLIVVVQEHPLTEIVRKKIGKNVHTEGFTKVGNKTYFLASVDGDANLYITDGTSAGTHFIKRLGLSQFNTTDQFTVVGDTLFFRTEQHFFDWRYNNSFLYKVKGRTADSIAGMNTRNHPEDYNELFLIGNENGKLLYRIMNKTYLYNPQNGKTTQR